MTKKEKWELCKPILLENDWTQEQIDDADNKTKNAVINAVDDFLKRKNEEQLQLCMNVLQLTNAQFIQLSKSIDFADSEFELQQILEAVDYVDKERLQLLFNILGEEKFKKCFSGS